MQMCRLFQEQYLGQNEFAKAQAYIEVEDTVE